MITKTSIVALSLFVVTAAQDRGESRPSSGPAAAAEKIYSGPQAGERTAGFKVHDVNGGRDVKEFDPVVESAGESALYFFFPADVNRILAKGITNISLMAAAAKEHGLHSYFIALGADPIAADQRLRDVWSSLKPAVPVSLSADGIEGPGSWGINKKCYATVVLAKNNKVVFNYASLAPADADYEMLKSEISKFIGTDLHVKLVTAPSGAREMGGREMGGRGAESREAPASRSARENDLRKARAQVWSDLKALDMAIQFYRLQNAAKLPTDLEALLQKDEKGDSYMKSGTIPVDPWGRPYVYRAHDNGLTYDLLSLGKDGKAGGQAEDTDVSLSDLREVSRKPGTGSRPAEKK